MRAPGRHATHFLIGVALSLATFPGSIGQVAGGAMHDPDSYMRLVRIRDGLAQGGFGTLVAADAGGAGSDIMWSHLLDAAILALRWPLTGFLGDEAALRWAGAVIGPLSVGGLAAAAAWAAAPLADRRWHWIAAVAAALAPVVAAYGALGCAHHHVALAAVATLLAGWAGRAVPGQARAAAAVGFWAGIGVWLSPELTPPALLAFGAVGLAWLLRPAPLPLLAAAPFAAVLLGAWWIDPPLGGHGVAEVDRLSLVSVVLALLLFAVALWLAGLDRLLARPWSRRGLGLAGLVAAAGVWLALFPSLLNGPTAVLPPEESRAFFGVIAEMQPASASLADTLSAAIGPLFAVSMALSLARRSHARAWLYAAACIVALATLGMLHWRFVLYGQVAGAVLLPVALTRLGAEARGALPRIAVIAGVLLAPMGLLRGSAAASSARAPTGARRCEVRDVAPALAGFGAAVILDDLGDTPELLYRTRLRTLGSLYHPAIGAFMAARAIWRSPPSRTVPDGLRANGVTLILMCVTSGHDPLVDGTGHRTLSDQLVAGEVPPWLVPVPGGATGGYRLYRVAYSPAR